MPTLHADSTPYKISDLVPEVIAKVENRTEDTLRATQWLVDALLEITAHPQLRNEFDELEVIGPLFNLSAPSGSTVYQEYAFSNIVPTGDYNVATLDITLFTNPPLNTNRIRLMEMSYQASDRVSPFPGQPCRWYRFGDTIGFSPAPDRAYTVKARIYRMHPLVEGSFGSTVLLIDRSYFELIIQAAAMRGFMELLEYEKANKIRELLYGDPKYPDRPGIIESHKKRREKEAWRNQGTLRPVVRRYSHRS